MWTTNAGLTDRHTYDSRPDAWPRLRRGIVRALLLLIIDCLLNQYIYDYRISGSWITARFISLETL